MSDLKELARMLADLPHAALWVIAAVLIYKVSIVGSIYGVLRLAIAKLHDWAVTKKAREVEHKEIRPLLDGMCIKAEAERLIAQIHRIRGKGVSIKTEHIHSQSVDWLREAIDDKIERDAAKANGNG